MNNSLKPNLSTRKVFQIIEVMAGSHTPMRIKDIAEKIMIPPATVLRFLHTLIDAGYVVQEPEGNKYYLTLKLSSLADKINNRFNLRNVVHPFLVELMVQCEESTCLAIEIDQMATYIDAVEGPQRVLRTLQRIGKSAPLHTTGVGKNLLLNYTPEQLNDLYKEKPLVSLTEKTITKPDVLLSEIQKIRLQGFALDDEECELGVRCVAAPLWDFKGRVSASISVSGPVSRMSGKNLESIKQKLMETADHISAILSGNASEVETFNTL